MHWTGLVSGFLMINALNSSIKKQMSNEATILVYSRYFSGCLRPCLTEARDAKDANSFIGGTSAEDASV